MNLKVYSSALAAVMLGLMASCSSEVNEPAQPGALQMKLAAAPQVNVWSGGHDFLGDGSKSRATDETAEGNAAYAYNIPDQVEVNLSINDIHMNEDGTQKYEVDDLVSKLSIHVRSGVDVSVNIPVGKDYYCDQDDMYIFLGHHDLFVNGGELENYRSSVSFKVGTTATQKPVPSVPVYSVATAQENGETPAITEAELTEEVTINIEFTEDAIIVTTEGITEGVIEWCKQHFEDGLNFEVYNYYNRSNMPVVDEDGVVVGGQNKGSFATWTLSDLKAALDQSEIIFIGGTPDFYINAFTGDVASHDNQYEYRDCYVTPEYVSVFQTSYWDYHYNGFDQNLIYARVKVEPAEGEKVPAAKDDRFAAGKAVAPAAPVAPEVTEE